MSREVIDDGASDTAPADEPQNDELDDDLEDDLDDETPAPPAVPDDPQAAPSRSPSSAPSRPPTRSAGPFARLRLLALVAVAIGSLALGGYAGDSQARQDDHAALFAGTRLIVWLAASQVPVGADSGGGQPIPATAISTGAPVLLHQLRTAFGTATFAPEVLLDSRAGRVLPIRLTPDCSTFDPNADPGGRPRTGTATVRERPGAPLREVPVELSSDFVTTAFVGPCGQLADPSLLSSSTFTTTVTTDQAVGPPNAPARPSVGFTDVALGAGSTLTFVVGLSGDPDQQVALDIAAADAAFTVSAEPALPILLRGRADPMFVTLHVGYRCPRGQPNVPFPNSVLRPRFETEAAAMAFGGWDTVVAGAAVRAAAALAGCPLS